MTDFDEELDNTLDDLDDIEADENDEEDFDDTDDADIEDDEDEEEFAVDIPPGAEFGDEEDTDDIEQLPDTVLNNPFAGLETDKAARKDIEAAKDLTKKK